MARRVLVTALLGASLGAIFSAVGFLLGALGDGAGLAEAFGYSLVVAVLGAFLGGIVGAAVGLGNLGTLGGATTGLLVALVVVGLYVLGFGSPDRYSHFLSESRVIIAGLTAPLIATGMTTALVNNVLGRRG